MSLPLVFVIMCSTADALERRISIFTPGAAKEREHGAEHGTGIVKRHPRLLGWSPTGSAGYGTLNTNQCLLTRCRAGETMSLSEGLLRFSRGPQLVTSVRRIQAGILSLTASRMCRYMISRMTGMASLGFLNRYNQQAITNKATSVR